MYIDVSHPASSDIPGRIVVAGHAANALPVRAPWLMNAVLSTPVVDEPGLTRWTYSCNTVDTNFECRPTQA